MHELYKKNVINPAVKFYVATLQDNEYERLKPEYILGMTETRRLKPNHLEIICLQVNPNLMHLTNRLTKYKGIGRSIIRALKAQKENKVISLTSMYSAANFYEKLGFKLTNPQQLVYMWKRFKTKH
jgi:NADH:ubiquinone oxidoreductase subunit C